MNRKLKIGLLSTGLLLLFLIARFVWIILENPYPRISLLGTAYIEDSDELFNLNNESTTSYLLVKKYKYSLDVWTIGYGGGGTSTKDYYGLGIANKNKEELIPPTYQYIYSIKDTHTKKVYIQCVDFITDGVINEDFYQIEGDKIRPLEKKPI